MPKRVTAYRDWIGGKLSDPRAAAAYLNAARKDSPEAFFKALRRVAESHQMAKVAEEAGVSRESLYRMTMASSNPTHTSFDGILRALGLDYRIVPASITTAEAQNTTPPQQLSPGFERPAGRVVDSTWKLNPWFAGRIGRQNISTAPTTLSFTGNPLDIAPVVHSANSNPGDMLAITTMQPRMDHVRREAGFQNA